jgi:hypothetical protein
MQDSTSKSQHQLRRGINPQVQEYQSVNMYVTCLYYNPCMYVTYLYCSMCMYASWPTVSLCTPFKTRVSETSTFWHFRTFLPLSYPLLICHCTLPFTAQYVPQPITNISMPSNNLCILLNHTPSQVMDIC